MNELLKLPGGYKCVVADPPWPYHSPRAVVGNGGRGSAGAESIIQADVHSHYKTMTMDEIKSLPVKLIVADAAHLYLWTTNSFMVEAHEVCRAWGFETKTIITWIKCKKEGFAPSMKTGYYMRSATEHCLFAVRGSLPLLVDEGIPTWFYHDRLPHSVKPDQFFRTVKQVSPGPHLEMFARRDRVGWDGWGNQVPESEEGFW